MSNIAFKCTKCGKINIFPERNADGHSCKECGGWLELFRNGVYSEKDIAIDKRNGQRSIVSIVDELSRKNPPKKKEPLTVNVNINGLDELTEQLKMLNSKGTKCDCGHEQISIEEQDKIIFNLLQDRYNWIKEDLRTMGEDEVKYKKQIEYLYNLYRNKIKQNETKR